MKKETKMKMVSAGTFICNLITLVFIKINFGEQAFDIGCVVTALITFWFCRKFFAGGAL